MLIDLFKNAWFVIPARKGSKGLPGKNRILLKYTIDTIPKDYHKKVIVSTDDIEIINTVTCDETIEGWLMAIVQMCRHIFRPNFNPLKVQLVREKPEIGAELFEQSFKCPVEFSSKLNAIHFAKEER